MSGGHSRQAHAHPAIAVLLLPHPGPDRLNHTNHSTLAATMASEISTFPLKSRPCTTSGVSVHSHVPRGPHGGRPLMATLGQRNQASHASLTSRMCLEAIIARCIRFRSFPVVHLAAAIHLVALIGLSPFILIFYPRSGLFMASTASMRSLSSVFLSVRRLWVVRRR